MNLKSKLISSILTAHILLLIMQNKKFWLSLYIYIDEHA